MGEESSVANLCEKGEALTHLSQLPFALVDLALHSPHFLQSYPSSSSNSKAFPLIPRVPSSEFDQSALEYSLRYPLPQPLSAILH